MRTRYFKPHYLFSVLLLLSSACASTWKSKAAIDPRLVARALNDPVDLPTQRINPASIPILKPPSSIRPCCAFGMDLTAKLGELPVPGYKNGNVLSAEEVGPHGYDSGITGTSENNGLVYTCRGGFIDTAHIRDNGDRTLYLAMEIARQLPAGFTINMPEEATVRRVIVKPLPPGVLERYGRWMVATTLAQWVNYQFSIWHEIATWYGWQSIKGFSERLSAFSLEDMYSNVLGERLAAGIVLNHETDSREAYNRAMDAWTRESLRRLSVVSKVDARRAMQSVDGLWWDSKQRIPDNKLVLRRQLNIASPQQPWLVTDAATKGPVRDELKQMCAKAPPPLPLSIPEQLGDQKIEELIRLEFEFAGWLPEGFPVTPQKGTVFTHAEFPAIMKDIRAKGEKDLGPGFDQLRPLRDEGKPVARALPARSGPATLALRLAGQP